MSDRPLQLYKVRPLTLNRRRVLTLFGAAALTGCASGTIVVQQPVGTRNAASVAGVPLILQKQYYCGPASLAMVLQWSGRDVTQQTLADQSFTPKARGTFKSDMIGTARRQGMLAVETNRFPDLLEEVDAGHPVIVFQNVGLSLAPAWHYGVLVGYDLDRKTVTLHSGERDVWTMPIGAFLDTWEGGDRWAMVMLPPERLPASLPEIDVLRAASALERVGNFREAEIAYQTGGKRWTGNWLWPFGLGNARYAQGDLAGAEAAFEAALARDPGAEAARNNLDAVRAEHAGRSA